MTLDETITEILGYRIAGGSSHKETENCIASARLMWGIGIRDMRLSVYPSGALCIQWKGRDFDPWVMCEGSTVTLKTCDTADQKITMIIASLSNIQVSE